MVKAISLKQLQREINIQKAKVRNIERREKLENELKKLKRSGRTDLFGRTGRGFVVLSKKVGGVAMKQARAIRERQIQQQKSIKKGRKKNSGFDPIGSLDF